MTRVWLIRHGQSTSNAGGVTQDPSSIPLTDLGHLQSQRVAEALPHAPDRFITSPFTRTQQTAEPASARFPDAPVDTLPIQEFVYLGAARFAGTTFHDRMPHLDAYWSHNDPDYVEGPGAESFATFLGRAEAFLDVLRNGPDDAWWVAFSHGHFIRVLLWRLLRGSRAACLDDISRFRSFYTGFPLPNASIVRLHAPQTGPVTLQPPDIAHLSGLPQALVASDLIPKR